MRGLLLAAAVLFAAGEARATSCEAGGPEPPFITFVGVVTDVEPPAPEAWREVITFETHELFRNGTLPAEPVAGGILRVRGPWKPGNAETADLDFHVGETWRINAIEKDGELHTGLCLHSTLLRDADGHLTPEGRDAGGCGVAPGRGAPAASLLLAPLWFFARRRRIVRVRWRAAPLPPRS